MTTRRASEIVSVECTLCDLVPFFPATYEQKAEGKFVHVHGWKWFPVTITTREPVPADGEQERER